MNSREIDDLLSRSALQNANTVAPDSAVVDRARGAVNASLAPVRPLPGTAALALIFVAICAAPGIAGGYALRVLGWPALDPLQRWVIFPVIAACATVAAVLCAGEMRPGAQRLRVAAVVSISCIALEIVFAVLFQDRGLARFIPAGLVCLFAGLAVATPVAIVTTAVLLRGAVLDRASAGAAVGLVAGLAGLCALEIHCPDLHLWHVAVWHVGVLLVSVTIAASVGARRRA
jgi:hypothetical protein